MTKNIAVIKGDGIGPEIVTEAIKVLDKVGAKFGHTFKYTDVLMGGCAIDATGVPLPQETIDVCLASDSVLLGAVGGKKWDNLPGNLRPEAGLLGIRGALKLFANIRPAKLLAPLASACPLKKEITDSGLDLVIVRELIGGAYFGERNTYTDENGVKHASDSMAYADYEVERICRVAFDMAKKRRSKVHSVDKANVLDSSRLRYRLSQRLHVHPKNVHAYQVGEHGDTEFALWSCANVGCQPIRTLLGEQDLTEIEDYARNEAYDIIKKKGATYYGIGSCLAMITNCILNDECRILSVSNYDEMSGTYNGFPAIVGADGIDRRLGIKIDAKEQEKLDRSIKTLREAIAEVGEN